MPTIANRTKQVQIFNIPCREGCDGTACLCSVITIERMAESPDGTRGVQVLEKRIPGSVTFLAGEKKEVPVYVAASRDVKRAIDRGALRLL